MEQERMEHTPNVFGIEFSRSMKLFCRYSFKLTLVVCAIFLILPLRALQLANAAGCPPSENMNKHVVFLKAGLAEKEEYTSVATGVLVSKTGLVLTVYDLLGDLGIKPSQLMGSTDASSKPPYKIVAKKKNKDDDQDSTTAYVVGHHMQRGLLLLKISRHDVGKMNLEPPEIGETPNKRGAKLCSIGYADGKEDPVEPKGAGKILSFDHINQYQFDTSFKFYKLQIGSPVFNEKCYLVGIASPHEDDNASITHVIPIELSDSLLSHVFISELNDELLETSKKLQPILDALVEKEGQSHQPEELGKNLRKIIMRIKRLQQKFDWEPLQQDKECGLIVSFEKLLDGEPQIISGEFHFDTDIVDYKGDHTKANSFKKLVGVEPVPTVPPKDLRPQKGTFCLKEGIAELEHDWVCKEWKSIKSITIRLNPIVKYNDGTENKNPYQKILFEPVEYPEVEFPKPECRR